LQLDNKEKKCLYEHYVTIQTNEKENTTSSESWLATGFGFVYKFCVNCAQHTTKC
jgi:hypothetical protein